MADEPTEHAPGADLYAAHRAFEDAWRGGRGPLLRDAVAGYRGDPLTLLSVLVPEDMYQRVKRGERPRAEAYRADFPALGAKPVLFLRLVVDEYRTRLRAGERPTDQDYLSRFPEFADHLPPLLRASRQEVAKVKPVVEGFVVLERLGAGSFGTVFKALNTRLKRVVALKVVPIDPADPAARRLRVEAEATARVAHPAVAQVFGASEVDNCSVLELEYVAGGSLAAHLDRGRAWAADEAVALVAATARGVGAAHAADVLHRDLKPANILLTPDDAPKVIDFGLAKQLDATSAGTQAGQFLGSPAYASPEQHAGDTGELSPATDVWALGVVLYQLLAGRLPFAGADMRAVISGIIHDTPDPPLNAATAAHRLNAADVNAVCLKCLEKAPGNRYRNADELADDLERALRGEPTAARPPGLLRRVGRRVRRNRVGAVLAAAVLAVGLAGVLYLELGARNQEVAQKSQFLQLSQELDGVPAAWTSWSEIVRGFPEWNDRVDRVAAEAPDSEEAHKLRAKWFGFVKQACEDQFQNGKDPDAIWGEDVLLTWLGRQDADTETRLRRLLTERRAVAWQPLMVFPTVNPFPPGVARVGTDSTRLALNDPRGQPASSTTLTTTGETAGATRLSVTFNLTGASARQVGLSFGAGRQWGGAVRALGTTKDQFLVYSGHADGSAHSWRPGSHLPDDNWADATANHPCCVAVSADGRLVAMASARTVVVKNAGNTTPVARLRPFDRDHRVAVAFIADTARLVVAAATNDVCRLSVWSVRDDKEVSNTLTSIRDIRDMKVSADGKWLAAACADGVHVWAISEGQLKLSTTFAAGAGKPTAVAFAPNNSALAVADDRGAVRLWSQGGWKPLPGFTTADAQPVPALAFAPDSTALAAAGFGEVQLWALPERTLIRRLVGHSGAVTAVAFQGDRRVVTGSDDGLVFVWDVASGTPEALFNAPEYTALVSVSPPATGENRSGRVTLGRVKESGGTATVRLFVGGRPGGTADVALAPDHPDLTLQLTRDDSRLSFALTRGGVAAPPVSARLYWVAHAGLGQVWWPQGADVTAVVIARKGGGAELAPLAAANALRAARRVADALPEYDRVAAAGGRAGPASRQLAAEARYKAADCRLFMNQDIDAAEVALADLSRQAESRPRGPQVADRPETDWQLVAAVRLWLHLLETDRRGKADEHMRAVVRPLLKADTTLVNLVPEALRAGVLDHYRRSGGKYDFYRNPQDHRARLDTLLAVDHLLAAPPGMQIGKRIERLDAYWIDDKIPEARALGRDILSRVEHAPPELWDDGVVTVAVSRYCWLVRTQGEAGEAEQLLTKWLDRPEAAARGREVVRQAWLYERACAWHALGDTKKAEADCDAARGLIPAAQTPYAMHAKLALMRGFLSWDPSAKKGDEAKRAVARREWAKGTYAGWTADLPPEFRAAVRAQRLEERVRSVHLMFLAGEATPLLRDEATAVIRDVVAAVGHGADLSQVEPLLKLALEKIDAFRAIAESDEAVLLSRDIAFQRLSFGEMFRQPALLVFRETLQAVLSKDRPYSADQKRVLDRAAEQGYRAFLDDKLKPTDVYQFAVWFGAYTSGRVGRLLSGGFDRSGVAAMPDGIAAAVSYFAGVFARTQKNDPTTATQALNLARERAAQANDPALVELIQKELDALKQK